MDWSPWAQEELTNIGINIHSFGIPAIGFTLGFSPKLPKLTNIYSEGLKSYQSDPSPRTKINIVKNLPVDFKNHQFNCCMVDEVKRAFTAFINGPEDVSDFFHIATFFRFYPKIYINLLMYYYYVYYMEQMEKIQDGINDLKNYPVTFKNVEKFNILHQKSIIAANRCEEALLKMSSEELSKSAPIIYVSYPKRYSAQLKQVIDLIFTDDGSHFAKITKSLVQYFREIAKIKPNGSGLLLESIDFMLKIFFPSGFSSGEKTYRSEDYSRLSLIINTGWMLWAISSGIISLTETRTRSEHYGSFDEISGNLLKRSESV